MFGLTDILFTDIGNKYINGEFPQFSLNTMSSVNHAQRMQPGQTD